MDGRTARLAALSIGGGVLFGVAARLADHTTPKWLGNAGATWFLVAFVVGRVARNFRSGAIAGAVCLATANTAYYLWRLLVDKDISSNYLLRAGFFWLVMSLACGIVAGAVGNESIRRPALWGVAAGVFAGEALAVLILRQRPTQVIVESLVAVLCLAMAIKSRTRDVAMAASLGFASVVVLGLSYRAALGR
jgi:hypothetical protein